MLNDQIPGDTSELVFGLKDGVILCNLANVFAKGVIKKNTFSKIRLCFRIYGYR